MRYHIEGTDLKKRLSDCKESLQRNTENAARWQNRAENAAEGEDVAGHVRSAFYCRQHAADVKRWIWRVEYDLRQVAQ